MAYTVEVEDNKSGFRFRLVKDAGTPEQRQSGWAGYTSIAMLDEMAAFTGYYAGAEGTELVPLTAAAALACFAITEDMGTTR